MANFSVSGGHSEIINLMLKVLETNFSLIDNHLPFLRFEDCISVGGVAHFNPLVLSLFIQTPLGRYDNSDTKIIEVRISNKGVRYDSFFL